MGGIAAGVVTFEVLSCEKNGTIAGPIVRSELRPSVDIGVGVVVCGMPLLLLLVENEVSIVGIDDSGVACCELSFSANNSASKSVGTTALPLLRRSRNAD